MIDLTREPWLHRAIAPEGSAADLAEAGRVLAAAWSVNGQQWSPEQAVRILLLARQYDVAHPRA